MLHFLIYLVIVSCICVERLSGPILNLYLVVLSLDVMDESGEHISEYNHDVFKERLDASGRVITKEKSEGKIKNWMRNDLFLFKKK